MLQIRMIPFLLVWPGLVPIVYTDVCTKETLNETWYLYKRSNIVTVTVHQCLRLDRKYYNKQENKSCSKEFEGVQFMCDEILKHNKNNYSSYNNAEKQCYFYDKKAVTNSVISFTTIADTNANVIDLLGCFGKYNKMKHVNETHVFVWKTNLLLNGLTTEDDCDRNVSLIDTSSFKGYFWNHSSKRFLILENGEDETHAVQIKEQVDECEMWTTEDVNILVTKNFRNQTPYPFPDNLLYFWTKRKDVYNDLKQKCEISELKFEVFLLYCAVGGIMCYLVLHLIFSTYNCVVNYVTFGGCISWCQANVNMFLFKMVRGSKKENLEVNEKGSNIGKNCENDYDCITTEYEINDLYTVDTHRSTK